jgi:hypothetical protein
MPQVMVRYKVKPDRVAENEALVRAVYEELADAEPEGIRYATFRLEDGVSFVHVALLSDGQSLNELPAFRRFTDGIRDRCDEPPAATDLHPIGAYRL